MSVYVLDSHGILYQNFHALPAMSGPGGEPVGAVYGFARDLFTLLLKHKPDRLFCAFDMHGETFRHSLYPPYKANRSAMPDDLRPQIDFARELLEAFRVVPLGLAGYEADDIMATIARLAGERGEDCTLVTADKDCRQLITRNVSLFNLRKQQRYSFAELKADWGVTPEQVVDFQAMCGDPTDNIPGIPLIGPKLASQLLEQFGSLDNILANVDQISGAKRKENIRNARETVELGRKLVTLDPHVPIAIDWDAATFKGVDAPALLTLFRRFGFKSLIDRVAEIVGEKGEGKGEKEERAGDSTIARSRSLFDEPEEKSNPKEKGSRSPLSPLPSPLYHLIDTPEKFDDFLAGLREQSCFAVDAETAPLEPAFEATMPRYTVLVGLSFCWDDSEAYYLPLRGPLGSDTLDQKTVLETLQSILEDPDIAKIGQNLKYDMVVLRSAGVELRGLAFDTMIADYLLHAGYRTHNLDDLAEYYLGHKTIPIKELIGTGKKQKRMDEVPTDIMAEYAGEDTWVVWRLFPMLRDLLAEEGEATVRLNTDLELPLVEVLADMEFTGIALDREKLKTLSVRFEETLRLLEKRIYESAGHEFNIASPKQLQTVLFGELNLPVRKKTAKSGPSTDAEVLEELAGLHELPANVLEYRQVAKLKGTYADTLPELIHPQTNRVHASFNQVVTATGRLSSSNPNLQNIPVKTEQGREIREAFVPGCELPAEKILPSPLSLLPSYDTIFSCDYSQIELRVLAHYCEDENLCNAFAEDRDIHTAVATEVFGVPVEVVDSSMRRTAKAVNFGVIYGQTAFGLARALKIPREDAARFIAAYFARYPKINTFIDATLAGCFRTGYVETLAGRRRMIEGVRPARKGDLTNPERTAINTVIQGSAADLMKEAMVRVHRDLAARKTAPEESGNRIRANMLLQIHDELVFETVASDLEPLKKLVLEGMSLDNPLRVPLKIDCESGPCWS